MMNRTIRPYKMLKHALCFACITSWITLSGCTTLIVRPEQGVDGIACIGTVTAPPTGLHEVTNLALQKQAQLESGKGGICAAKVFVTTTPVRIYRVYDASQAHSKFGEWWTFKRPSGTKEAYRAANAICQEWSHLDRVLSCELKVGIEIVVGTTQSAACNQSVILPKTIENQIFIPKRIGTDHLLFDSCQEENIKLSVRALAEPKTTTLADLPPSPE